MLRRQQHANLADHSYGRRLDGTAIDLKALEGKLVTIECVTYKVLKHADKPSGYRGTTYQRIGSGDVVVVHRDTELGRESLRDGVLTDGGIADVALQH